MQLLKHKVLIIKKKSSVSSFLPLSSLLKYTDFKFNRNPTPNCLALLLDLSIKCLKSEKLLVSRSAKKQLIYRELTQS